MRHVRSTAACRSPPTGEASSLLVPLARVGRVGLGRDGLDDDGHEAVQGAAELGALAVENALALDEGRDAVDAARRRVGLDAQGRDGEAVEHILAGDQEADVRTRGQRQALVDLEVADHARLQVLIRHQVALELVERRDLGSLEVLLRSRVVLRPHVADLGLPVLGAEGLQGRSSLLGRRLAGGPEEGLQRGQHLWGRWRVGQREAGLRC
mmetsp:Transcript_90724/g.234265  ORF Transcript_90724/g.234265 Transcript_90724/m.234265 type:complete len:210 (+) Transcript_90724:141-770(+)